MILKVTALPTKTDVKEADITEVRLVLDIEEKKVSRKSFKNLIPVVLFSANAGSTVETTVMNFS